MSLPPPPRPPPLSYSSRRVGLPCPHPVTLDGSDVNGAAVVGVGEQNGADGAGGEDFLDPFSHSFGAASDQGIGVAGGLARGAASLGIGAAGLAWAVAHPAA
jgi:hypothetical protein